MSTNREIVLDFLASNGPARPAVIYKSLGIKKNTASRLFRDMIKAGHLAKQPDGVSLMLGHKTLSRPNPAGSSELPKAAVRRDGNIPVWNAGVEYDRNGGELRTPPVVVSSPDVAVTPDERDIFRTFGMKAEEWTIDTLRRSTWQSFNGEWLEAYRAVFSKRKGANLAPLSEEDINNILLAYSYTTDETSVSKTDGSVRLVAIGDTQLGKPDGGGTKATVERFYNIMEQVKAGLIASGGVDFLILPWLGDCLEGVVSQGGRNVARLDISITEQVRIYRRLFLHQVATLAPYARKVIIPVVGGNHDEAFRDQTQSPNDSWAIEGASAVADALVLADKFDHVQFLFPEPERWGVTLNVGSEESPYVIHFEHGHQARNQTKVIDWWKGQTHGRQPAGAADMLITAHWHNFQIQSTGGDRWWMQVPSMDGGSDWYRDKSGEDSAPGVLAFDVVGGASGWSNLNLYR